MEIKKKWKCATLKKLLKGPGGVEIELKETQSYDYIPLVPRRVMQLEWVKLLELFDYSYFFSFVYFQSLGYILF